MGSIFAFGGEHTMWCCLNKLAHETFPMLPISRANHNDTTTRQAALYPAANWTSKEAKFRRCGRQYELKQHVRDRQAQDAKQASALQASVLCKCRMFKRILGDLFVGWA
jgi:hypothetical protein